MYFDDAAIPAALVRTLPFSILVLTAMLCGVALGGDLTGRPIFGTLQSEPAHAAADVHAGVRLATVGLVWSAFEPRQGVVDPAYVAGLRKQIAAFRAAGMGVVLDVGLQYPPGWIYAIPNSRFVDQYGDPFNEDEQPGYGGMNAVFNQRVRDQAAQYLRSAFKNLGTDFFAVRLGGGYFGELHYPNPVYRGHRDCYWGFDAIAQGRAPGIPPTIGPCPVPGWIPGTPAADLTTARRFADWYLNAITDYQNWQIATVRRDYAGTIFMLYPSWGLRPGDLDHQVAAGLKFSGNTELMRGNDFARQIKAITDPKVAVYCTWSDADFPSTDDRSRDPSRWCPLHYLAYLAQSHKPPLAVWAENTGRPNSAKQMQLSFQRLRDYSLGGLFWAFEPDLYGGKPQCANIDDFARNIAAVTTP